jgi:hypothetical protein
MQPLRPSVRRVVLALGVAILAPLPALAQMNADCMLLQAPYRVEPSPVSAQVVRTAPFTSTSGFGVAEDLATGQMIFSDLNAPFLVEFRNKDLSLIRTINIPNQGNTMTGIAYDPKNDTIWVGDRLTRIGWEYDKNTGAATGGSVSMTFLGGLFGGFTIDPNDGLGGDTAYLEDVGFDTVAQFSIRTGTVSCGFQNPGIPGAFGNGVTYAAVPAFPGDLFVTTGTNDAGRADRIARGNPCAGSEFVDFVYLPELLPGETFPNGLQSSVDPSVDPSEVFYILGSASSTIYEIQTPQGVEDCHGVDDERILFVNGSNEDHVRVPEGWPLHFGIWKPSGGGNGRYVVHLNAGRPDDGTISELPFGLGPICFPILLPPAGAGSPVAVWNCIGKPGKVGSTNYFSSPLPDPPPAPVFFFDRPEGDAVNLVSGSEFTVQGVILNPASSSPKGASVTNGVVLQIGSPPF